MYLSTCSLGTYFSSSLKESYSVWSQVTQMHHSLNYDNSGPVGARYAVTANWTQSPKETEE